MTAVRSLWKGMNALILLGIDTSGKTASVAVCDEENVLAQTSVLTRLTHSQVIMPLCNDVLRNAGIPLSAVDAIVVSNGPGSYTGLRIGVSAVKAMCYATKKKCLGVSTLESLAYNMRSFHGVICPVMKARLNLMYTAFFTSYQNDISRIFDDTILSVEDIVSRIKAYHGDIILVGDGAQEFTDAEVFLKCIREELPYFPTTGFHCEVLPDDPAVRKQVDDIFYDFFGEENPHQIEDYQNEPKQDMAFGGV